MVGKSLYVRTAPLEHGDFETAVMIEMNMQRRLRQIVMIVKIAR